MPTRTTLQLCAEAAIEIGKNPHWLDEQVGTFKRWLEEANSRLKEAEIAEKRAVDRIEEAEIAESALETAKSAVETLIRQEIAGIEILRGELTADAARSDSREARLDTRERELEEREARIREIDFLGRENALKEREHELDRRSIYLDGVKFSLEERERRFMAEIAGLTGD